MKFLWDQSYSVKVEKFDKQHQQFFTITNNIYDLVQNTAIDRDKLFSQVLELVNYGNEHLASEEDAFEKYKYPLAGEHIQKHAYFRQQTQNYLEKCMNADTNLSELATELVDFASSWLIEHISSVDKQYSAFLENKEII